MFPNQRQRFERESGFGEDGMRREAAKHENFFIAKQRDSESAQPAPGRLTSSMMSSSRHLSLNCSSTESPAPQAYLAKLAGIASRFSHLVCAVARMICRALDVGASCALASAHQHFLKRDAVFSNVLVYSGCSAFRFPSARSN